MKKLISLLLALVLCCTCAFAELTITVPEDLDPAAVANLTVDWIPMTVGGRCVMTWQANGNDYEAAITGLNEPLTDEQVQQVLSAWQNRSVATLTGNVVDAEKYSNRLGYKTGEWLVNDTEQRKEEAWGDSSMCWAAAASNMLWNTGWATKAVNPMTGKAFASEDEVFELFIKHFLNAGGWSGHGIRWFFTGNCYELDLKERWQNNLATAIDGYQVLDYLHGTMNEENPTNTTPAAMTDFVSIVRRIKDGATVGMSVGFNEEHYPMPGNLNDSVWWSVQHNSFVHSPVLDVKPEDCTQGYYTFDKVGFALPVTQQDGQWIDENGDPVLPESILVGKLYYCADHWWVAEPFNDGVIVPAEFPLTTDEFDVNDVQLSNSAAHQHAITLSGYVMNLSAADAGDMVEAMFIANSDDDAVVWRITDETTPREGRINQYIMYPTSVHTCDEGAENRTICLEQFMAHNLTLINNMVALDAMPE